MARRNRELLVVDGYNVIYKTSRYTSLMDEPAGDRALGNDPFDRARSLLVADVAAYAQGRYEAVIVFDGSGNVSPDRPDLHSAGVRLLFSRTGESADTVIERLVTECRQRDREVTVVTSDNTIRATVGGIPVTRVSSSALISDVKTNAEDARVANDERNHQRLTVQDRLDPATRAKLDALLGRLRHAVCGRRGVRHVDRASACKSGPACAMILIQVRWRSSMAEPRFCKPVVVGSTPIASSIGSGAAPCRAAFLFWAV